MAFVKVLVSTPLCEVGCEVGVWSPNREGLLMDIDHGKMEM